MREIKFRVWDKLHEIMDKMPFSYSMDLDAFSLNDCFAEIEYVYMQYVGRTDKTGAEIYEGDILKREHNYAPEDQYDIAVVEYSDDRLCFRFNSVSKKGIFFDTSHPNFKFKVIGNIYENKDLLN